MSGYDDIINLPRWNPKSHPRMSDSDRAAQFAPFSALSGYDAMVSETSRLTDSKGELDEEQMLALNQTLSLIVGRINEHPRVSVTWFRKDSRKKGGQYVKTEGTVRDVNLADRILVLKEGVRIFMDDIAVLSMIDGEISLTL